LRIGADRSNGPIRDPLEAYRLFELFCVLGVPLEVTIRANGKPQQFTETTLFLAVSLPQVSSVFWQWEVGFTSYSQLVPPFLESIRRQFLSQAQ
jgi:hypothetical protein